MLGMTPASDQQAVATADHPFDQAVLLMFSSQMRLNGEVESAVIPADQIRNAHLAAFSFQTQTEIDNEINAVIDLYATMIANLQASNNYSRQVEDQLVAQMNEKVDALQAKAQALAAKRSRRRGGFFRSVARLLNRALKAVGRGTGWVMGKAMDSAGEVAEFAIEEVSPQVLKAHIMGGASLNWKLFRQVGREILKKRGVKAAENFVLRLAERIARRQAAQGEALPTLDAVAQATLDTFNEGFMDAFEDGDDSGQDSGADPGGASGESSSGSNTVSYTFTEGDTFNFGSDQFYTGGFGWDKWSGRMENEDWCYFNGIEISTGTVYLEFDRDAMTVSGWIEGSGRKQELLTNASMDAVNVSASYQIEFSDLPAALPTEFEIETALKFVGTVDANVTIGGAIACRYRDADTNQDMYRQITDQTSVGVRLPLKIVLYKPGITVGNHPATLGIHTDSVTENGINLGIDFLFDQPIDVPLP